MMKARSHNEIVLWLHDHPCEQCGGPIREDDLRFRVRDRDGERAEHVYEGTCPRCHHPREVRFDVPAAWPAISPFAYGEDEPSSLFSAARFLAAAEAADAAAPDEPPPEPEPFFAAGRKMAEAIGLYREVLKFPGADRDRIEARIAAIEARRAPYVARRERMDELSRTAAAARPPAPFGREALEAHAKWWARGRFGPGRLELEDVGLDDLRLGTTRLSAARLIRCKLSRTVLDFAHLEEAELIECTGEQPVLAHAALDAARLIRCRLWRARLTLARLEDVEIEGGSLERMSADRAACNRLKARGVHLRDAFFGDAVLDGAYFEDCDLRGADLSRQTPALITLCSTFNTTFVRCDLRGVNLDGRRLDGTVFIDCKMADLRGTPVIAGEYVVERPDLSAAGDGSDVRTGDELYRRWGPA